MTAAEIAAVARGEGDAARISEQLPRRRRQLGLALDNDHPAHAVWFRMRDRIDIDGWSDDAAWRSRCVTPTRWLSTNHLVGAGYWVWLIPLASGSHSVGIVADPAFHPSESMDSFDKAMDWLRVHRQLDFTDYAALWQWSRRHFTESFGIHRVARMHESLDLWSGFVSL